jgi:hypothetical protein
VRDASHFVGAAARSLLADLPITCHCEPVLDDIFQVGQPRQSGFGPPRSLNAPRNVAMGEHHLALDRCSKFVQPGQTNRLRALLHTWCTSRK